VDSRFRGNDTAGQGFLETPNYELRINGEQQLPSFFVQRLTLCRILLKYRYAVKHFKK